jgi:protein-tyrosine phosphatase
MAVKVLMVCLGNICRSPMAEGLLRHKVRQLNLAVETDSAGTTGYHIGSKPDQRMIDTAANQGVDISDLRARKFQASDLETFDYVFAMDKENQLKMQSLAKNETQRAKVKLFLEQVNYPELSEVPDPYYGDQAAFEFVFNLLDEATDTFINQMTMNIKN